MSINVMRIILWSILVFSIFVMGQRWECYRRDCLNWGPSFSTRSWHTEYIEGKNGEKIEWWVRDKP